MRRILPHLIAFACAASLAQAGDIAIYKGSVTTVSLKPANGKLKKKAEHATGYFIITLPDAIKASKGVFVVPGKDDGAKVLRQSRTFDLVGQIVAMSEPKVQGQFTLSGATDYGFGYTGLSARGALKNGLKDDVNASQDIPKILQVTERYVRVLDDEGRGHYERLAGLKLDKALTKAANDASENLDAAVTRVRNLFPNYAPGAGF